MKNISVIGGDNRNLILSNLLEQDGNNIFRYGLDTKEEDMMECIKKSDYIITATPFSMDNENIYCVMTDEKINIRNFINLVHNKTIFAGNISKEYVDLLNHNGNKVIDVMKNNNLAIKNAIPTAEGVIKIIIEKTNITIDNSNIAVLGFGRVGKRISKVLHGMGANVFCYDTNKEEVANIELCRYNVLEDIYEELESMNVIINTVPQKIINEEEFKFINKNCLIIDVSSKPGGINFEYANKNGYNVIHALGLPGKIAPITSAKYIKEIVDYFIV